MEDFKTPEQQRNLDEDRRLFIEAVKNVLIEEIPTEFDETTIRHLSESIDKSKLFLLGETHGVKENVDVIYTLFKKLGFRQLALEWEPKLKNVAEKFIESGEIDFNTIKDSPDGRITAGHFALIKKLKLEGMLDELICFNSNSNSNDWSVRDANMAKNILSSLSDKPTLAVAGNLHTKTHSINLNLDGEPSEQHPMGENVKKEIPDISSGKIKYLSGQYHNYGIKEFNKSTEVELPPKAKFYKNSDDLYIFELPESQAATVPNPSEKL